MNNKEVPTISEERDAEKAKIEMINSYLESCARDTEETPDNDNEKGNCYDADRPVAGRENERENMKIREFDDQIERPTKNSFWRDGEEVFTDDATDGLSTDFRVRLVYLNIAKTLNLYVSCEDVSGNIGSRRKLKDFLRALRYEKDAATEALKNELKSRRPAVSSNQRLSWYPMMSIAAAAGRQAKPTERAGRLMSNLRNLALAADTSKGARRLVVNQMDPYSCQVSIERLQTLCRFCGFTEYNATYGTLGCRFYLPIKLLFLGNLETKRFDQDDCGDEEERPGYTFYDLHISQHFGSYFFLFLENLYNVCFDKLTTELSQYKQNKNKQGESMKERFGGTSSASSLPSHRNDKQLDLLDRLDELNRHDGVKTLGTSGRLNHNSRLRYIRYDKTTANLVEDEPVEEADAVFVSSYIGVRINNEGEVRMDVYARHALLLEMYNNEDDI